MKKYADKYPFLFIIDDGGFDFTACGKIGMETYFTILKIAKEFSIKIPICFTMKYLDKENISSVGTPLKYVDDLIIFLKSNSQYIEIGYHGLTHEYNGYAGEFYNLHLNEIVPSEIQRRHIEKSKQIFDYWNLDFPELCVPPCNAWERGGTDKILSDYGVKYLVSTKENLHYGNEYGDKDTKYLEFLPRDYLGIYSYDCQLDKGVYRRSIHISRKVILNYAKHFIIPRSPLMKLRLKEFFKPISPIHSYMVHIGNFTPLCYNFWRELLRWVRKNKNLYLCRNSYESIRIISQIRYR